MVGYERGTGQHPVDARFTSTKQLEYQPAVPEPPGTVKAVLVPGFTVPALSGRATGRRVIERGVAARTFVDGGGCPMDADAVGKAEQVGDSAALEVIARAGLVAYGLVHLLIGWLALKIAWGSAGNSADASGAMSTLAAQPFGKVLLWVLAVGLAALALWQLGETIWAHRYRRGLARVGGKVTSAASALVYLALGISAASVALGSHASSSQSEQRTTSGVLALPGGRVIIVGAGLVIIGIGVAGLIKGIRRSFSEEIDMTSMSPAARAGVTRLGQLGYITKGLALGVVGALLSYATLNFERQNTQGLDGAMQTILAQPFGKFLLTAVAVGFIAFGVFAILQSRYRRM